MGEAITTRISHWTTKCLSYAGRLQLVSSVLMSMHIYWCSIFIILASVIKGVEDLCRKYLWHGMNSSSKGGLVNWSNLKKLSFWGITKPNDASWSWRQMVNIRSKIESFFVYNLGDGSRFSFWFDPWANGMSLVNRFPEVDIMDTDIDRTATVNSLWRNRSWHFPDPFDDYTLSIWDYIKRKFEINPLRPDKVLCKPHDDFSIKSSIMDKLHTRDKMLKWGVIHSNSCCFCNSKTETVDHLFFECDYSKAIWRKLLVDMNFNRDSYHWRREVSSLVRRTKGKSKIARDRKNTFCAAIYHIWRARNEKIFNQNLMKEGMLVALFVLVQL
ncbi:uncharacterized protein LOC126655448 [Mercurialis annua]|uniref:uncharacterized protein LOC126655448 n=1 Tax=Mercurialis annua TaxID=3986 RepID=UPI00215FA3A8|nr:uncharacterized protein LOC126655448 [Mercurialis annua]